jgi:hypothetical protein
MLSKFEEDEIYKGKVRKNFFKNEEERMLWVRLNAEHIQYSTKILNHKDVPLGEIGKPFSCMQISLNQLTYDEYESDAPRFSFEELVLPHDELFRLADKRNRETIKKMFKDCFGEDAEIDDVLNDEI